MSKSLKISHFSKFIYIGIITALSFCIFSYVAQAVAPVVETWPASDINKTSAFFNGRVNPNGSYAHAWFEYGLTPSLGTTIQSWGPCSTYCSGTRPIVINKYMTDLKENSVYYYRAVAIRNGSNEIGYGDIWKFDSGTGVVSYYSASNNPSTYYSTPTPTPYNPNQNGYGYGSAPSIGSQSVSSIYDTSVVLNGSVNPNNALTNAWFEYGKSESLENGSAGYQTLQASSYSSNISYTLTGLSPNTKYYYRISANNNYGTVRNGIGSFTTANAQPVTTPVPTPTPVVVYTNAPVPTPIVITKIVTVQAPQPVVNPSVKSDLGNTGPVLLQASNIKPGPGEEFTVTINFSNKGDAPMSQVSLKVILPEEVTFVGSTLPPSSQIGNMLVYNFGNTGANSGYTITITVRVNETAKPGANLIFTVILEYVDSFGKNQSMNSYLTVQVGEKTGGDALGAMLGTISGFGSGILFFWLVLGTFIVWLISYVVYRKYYKNGNGDGYPKVADYRAPPTVQ